MSVKIETGHSYDSETGNLISTIKGLSEIKAHNSKGKIKDIVAIYAGKALIYSPFSTVWRGANIWKGTLIWRHGK